jgi:protein associated with RNAse G/E
MQNPKVGDRIQVHACKADGKVYRYWTAVIEYVSPELVITIGQAGSPMFNAEGGIFHIEHHLRAYYWFGKFYNLIEVFEPGGDLIEVYINIASPPEWTNGTLKFKDHELDVSKYPPKPAEIIDEDEFAEAVMKYNYPVAFQEQMYAAAREALEIAENWAAKPCPVFGENHA